MFKETKHYEQENVTNNIEIMRNDIDVLLRNLIQLLKDILK